jgi:pimeloyl-ACP methyl ester carboxylesterase
MSQKTVFHNDVKLCTESFGDAGNPAVLLMAGATVSMLYWDDAFCQQLTDKGLLVIRYDNRDTGQSTTYEPGTTPYDIVDLVEDSMAILDAYDIPKAHLVGMSLGGLLAQIAALKYPRRVQTLTLQSTGPWGDADPEIPEMDQRIVAFQSRQGDVDWTNEDEVVQYMLEGAILISGQKEYDTQSGAKLFRNEFRRAEHYVSMFNHARVQGGESYYNRLNEITQPVLIIHGTADHIWPFQHTAMLQRELKNTRLITLEGTGHELHRDDWNTIINGIAYHVLTNQ